jgi:protein gp37
VIGGVTTENQKCADERIPMLLQANLAMRFISCEPKLGDIDFSGQRRGWLVPSDPSEAKINWVIIGGENDADADWFDIDGARRLICQCKNNDVPVFLKQLGSRPKEHIPSAWPKHVRLDGDGFGGYGVFGLRHRAGADPAEWPEDLRVQQMHRRLAA